MSGLKSRPHKDLKFIKLSFSLVLLLLLGALPILTTKIKDSSQDTRSDAATETDVTGPIQSWIVSPNGGEIVYGNTEIQFFAQNAADENAKFTFRLELLRADQFIQTMFSYGTEDQLSVRNGIRSVYYDFTGLAEANNYRLKLTTTDASGQNVIEDYSDSYFTISPNNTKPEFTSTPSKTNISVGEPFSYDVTVNDASQTKVLATAIPDWLKFENNKLFGTPSNPGVYSIVLIAANPNGRQTTQVFSINVAALVTPAPEEQPSPPIAPTSTPTPVVNKPTTQPTPIASQARSINIILPADNRFSSASSSIKVETSDEVYASLSKLKLEISKDGQNWETVREEKAELFNLDISPYEGGEYFLRFTYQFTDGTSEVRNIGPIQIVKQDSEESLTNVLIKDIKPSEGAKLEDRKPTISASFIKPAGSSVDLKKFKFVLDGNDLTKSSELRVNVFSFSYVPESELEYGKHEVLVEVAAENTEIIQKRWSFEIVDPNEINKETEDSSISGIFTRNKLLLSVIIAIIILIFVLSIWAIALSKKEKRYYSEERSIVE